MKNKTMKILALCICVVMLTGALGGAVLALGGDDKEDKTEEPEKTAGVEEAATENEEVSKDETVYVIAGADGSVKKVIVSDWIKNSLGEAVIDDSTELTDIENEKGDESYTPGGGNTRVWDAEGNDIYYQGNIDKELPVDLKISYKLDGKSVTPEELKGKSGKVTIRFDYENRQYETVKIGGKDEKIYVPFAMLTGLILDNDVFTNVEVSNGKLINDGSRTIVAGLAFPGLQDDLGIDAEKFMIPDHVEITADAKDFSLGMTVTVATNELFNKLDPEKLDDVDKLTGQLDELTGAMSQLIDGSSKLYDGLCTLLDKSGELVAGIDKLAAGAEALKNGADELDGGVGQLQGGVNALADGLNTLASNNDSLNGGAKQVFETLLATAKTQLTAAGLEVPDMTTENYAEVLNAVIDSLDDEKVYAKALQAVTEGVESKRGYITEQVTAAVASQVEAGVTGAVRSEVEIKVSAAVRPEVEARVTAAVREQVAAKVTEAVKAEVTARVTSAVRENVAEKVIPAAVKMDKASYEQAVAAGLVSTEIQAQVTAAIDAQMETDEVKQTIAQNVGTQMSSDTVASTVEAQTDAQMETDAVKQAVAQNTDAQMSSDEVKAIISSKTDEQMATDGVGAIIAANIDAKMNSDEIKTVIGQNVEAQVQKAIADTMAGEEVQANLAAASDGAKQVISLKTSLDSYNAFYLGLQSYTAGVAQAASGANELKSGAAELKAGSEALSTGANDLYNGILTLKDGAPALVDGITKLRDGSMTLSDCLKEFNEKGVQKLVDAVRGDLSGLLDRVRATMEVSNNYRNFAGILDGMDGQVKFIYRTEEIGE